MGPHPVGGRIAPRRLIAAAVAAAVLAAPSVAHAKTISIREHANPHLARKSGSTLYESGSATGTLPGNVSAIFKVSLTSVSGTVTIYPRGGSLKISISGKARSTGVRARFGGSMRVVSGTGKYRGMSDSGSFEGAVNRRTWAASVDANARPTY